MPSPFAAAAALAEPAVDATFSEAFAFMPMSVPVNGVPAADNSRASVASFQALFDAGGAVLAGGDGGLRSGAAQRVVAEAQIVFRASLLPNARRGDRVTRATTSKTYELRDPRPAGFGRLAAHIVEVPA